MDGPDGEERPERLEEPVGQVVGGRLEHQGEAQDETGRPREELGDQRDRSDRRQDGVLGFVGAGQPGEAHEDQPNGAVDPQRHPGDTGRPAGSTMVKSTLNPVASTTSSPRAKRKAFMAARRARSGPR